MKGILLLNMGGARSEQELRSFLFNMFSDKAIIRSPMRYLLAPLISTLRYKKIWKKYELIGGSKIYEYTDRLVEKLRQSTGEEVFPVMRYTHPLAADLLADRKFDQLILVPLYPHYSSTTTKSSFEDVYRALKRHGQRPEVREVGPYFDDPLFNASIIERIREQYQDRSYHLVFSAHGLPQKIAAHDPYEQQINEHVAILKTLLAKAGIDFKGFHLAYQSKVGPMRWLEPSLDTTLKGLAGEKVIVYPLSFTIDNSETDLELAIEYKEIARILGLLDYRVCQVQNDSDLFVEFLAARIAG
ncbi:MAG: ferrochelatase [Desulfoarculaceae bacterium]|nr:ferrochelatase [Desulfoarculaceae bacterium]